MPPEVVQAMAESVGYFVDLADLHRRAGEYIAEITGADAGMVTDGCAAAMVLQAAACMTGEDPDRIARLPDSTGMRNEVLMQREHRNHYDSSFQFAGARLVEVSPEATSPEALSSAITDKTAAVAYTWVRRFWGLPLDEVVKIAHARETPVILDAASELPPVENLTRFISMGVDMVAFSGGKGVRGPQSTGILAGRRDLMRAAWENAFSFDKPRAGIGRPMKVCKEEIVGLVRALELFLDADHETEWARWRSKAQHIVNRATVVSGVTGHVHEGPIYEGPTAPTAIIDLGASWQGPTAEDLRQALLQGEPAIHIGSGPGSRELWVAPVELQDGDEEIVARRLLELLSPGASLGGSQA